MNKHSAAIQRLRLIKRLRQGSCTTIQARHELDILGVAPRVHELRHQYGYNIQREWVRADNPGGGRHRVAQYVLMPGTWEKGGAHGQS